MTFPKFRLSIPKNLLIFLFVIDSYNLCSSLYNLYAESLIFQLHPDTSIYTIGTPFSYLSFFFYSAASVSELST